MYKLFTDEGDVQNKSINVDTSDILLYFLQLKMLFFNKYMCTRESEAVGIVLALVFNLI